jgi:predicted nucleic acid-binding protein
MSVLVDTNVLLRRTQPNHPHHATAVESVARLLAAGEPVCFTLGEVAKIERS